MRCLVPWCVAFLPAMALADGPRGVYRAKPVPDSPVMLASGMAWGPDGLVVADRKGKRVALLRPSGKFETLVELENPFGVAFDERGRMLVTEKLSANRILRRRPDGTMEVLVDSPDAGTPHAMAVHRNGTIYWSGFPDGGTRSRRPDGTVTIHKPRIGHTFGIALTPKQDWLVVTSKLPDKDRRAVWRFPVSADGSLGEGAPYFFLKDLKPALDGLPAAKDGGDTLVGWIGRVQWLAVDRVGNFYVGGAESHTSGAAVAVISPDGKEVRAMILDVPGNVSSLRLSHDDATLYIAGAGEYRLHAAALRR